MPSNPNKDTQKARMFIVKQLGNIPEEGVLLKDLELRVLVSFAVADSYPRRFIKEYFLETGAYELDGGLIKRCA